LLLPSKKIGKNKAARRFYAPGGEIYVIKIKSLAGPDVFQDVSERYFNGRGIVKT
jgi:hypothetical protein